MVELTFGKYGLTSDDCGCVEWKRARASELVCRHDSSFKAGDGNRAGYPARWRMWNAKTAQMREYSIDRSDTDSTLNR